MELWTEFGEEIIEFELYQNLIKKWICEWNDRIFVESLLIDWYFMLHQFEYHF